MAPAARPPPLAAAITDRADTEDGRRVRVVGEFGEQTAQRRAVTNVRAGPLAGRRTGHRISHGRPPPLFTAPCRISACFMAASPLAVCDFTLPSEHSIAAAVAATSNPSKYRSTSIAR